MCFQEGLRCGLFFFHVVAEWHSECFEKGLGFGVGGRRSDKNKVKSDLALDLIKFYLREDGLIRETYRVVAATVEALEGEPTKVPNIRAGDVNEAVKELPHDGTSQGRTSANEFALADFEVSDGLASVDDGRLLAGDLCDLGDGVFYSRLAIIQEMTDVAADDDFFEARHLIDVFVAVLFGEVGDNLLFVEFLQGWFHNGGSARVVRLKRAGLGLGFFDVGDMDRPITLFDASFGVHLGLAEGFFDFSDTFDDDLAFGGVDGEDGALLSFVVTGNDDDFVTGFDMGFDFHGLSGVCGKVVCGRFTIGAGGHGLEHLGSEGNDFHKVFFTQLASHGAENTGALGVAIFVDDHHRIFIEAKN